MNSAGQRRRVFPQLAGCAHDLRCFWARCWAWSVKAEGVDFSIGRCFAWLQLFARSAVLRLVRESHHLHARKVAHYRACEGYVAQAMQHLGNTKQAERLRLCLKVKKVCQLMGVTNQLLRIRNVLEWL